MMYALITSRLFDGVSGFDNIHHMQMKPGYSLQHTYNKLAMLLALQHMYVEDDAGDPFAFLFSSMQFTFKKEFLMSIIKLKFILYIDQGNQKPELTAPGHTGNRRSGLSLKIVYGYWKVI